MVKMIQEEQMFKNVFLIKVVTSLLEEEKKFQLLKKEWLQILFMFLEKEKIQMFILGKQKLEVIQMVLIDLLVNFLLKSQGNLKEINQVKLSLQEFLILDKILILLSYLELQVQIKIKIFQIILFSMIMILPCQNYLDLVWKMLSKFIDKVLLQIILEGEELLKVQDKLNVLVMLLIFYKEKCYLMLVLYLIMNLKKLSLQDIWSIDLLIVLLEELMKMIEIIMEKKDQIWLGLCLLVYLDNYLEDLLKKLKLLLKKILIIKKNLHLKMQLKVILFLMD